MNISKEDQKKCGIYIIKNNLNGKVYVGSTRSFKERYDEHRLHLSKNKHHNPRLQHAWNKYDSDSFIFEIVEIIDDKSERLPREAFWISQFNSSDDSFGYNITAETDKYKRLPDIMKRNAKSYFVISPYGEEFTVENINDFCQKNNLDVRSMRKVARGANQHTKYWRCWLLSEKPIIIDHQFDYVTYKKEENLQISRLQFIELNKSKYFNYTVTSPTGEKYYPTSLKDFCKNNKLSEDSMYMVSNKIINDYKGWTVTKIKDDTCRK